MNSRFNPEFLQDIRGYIILNSDKRLEVKKTSLEGCEFKGLFAKGEFSKGELVCVYKGNILRTKEAIKLKDKSYLMRLGDQCYIDAKDSTYIHARYLSNVIHP